MSTFIEEMQREARKTLEKNSEVINKSLWYVNPSDLDSLIADVVGKVVERVEVMRKDEVKWKKAKYDVKSVSAVCYNKALDDIRDLLAHKSEKKEHGQN